ncbi:MAG TPA: hypothetical protein VF722_10800 [Gemmatimonadaceae bacterium]|jgi:hypothetical protein
MPTVARCGTLWFYNIGRLINRDGEEEKDYPDKEIVMNDGSVIKATARPWLVAAGVAACMVALGACGSDFTGPQPRPASTTYTGVIVANNDQGGQLDLQFSSALARRLSDATGSPSFQASGTCSSVCGTAFGALPITGGSVTGDSVTFTFNGGFDNTEFTAGGKVTGGRLTGTFAASDQSVTGTFTAYSVTSTLVVTTYCGSWISTTNSENGGGWYLLASGTEMTGWYTNAGQVIRLDGTVNAPNVTLKADSGGVTAQGTIPASDGSDIGGNYTSSSDNGTWTGGACFVLTS